MIISNYFHDAHRINQNTVIFLIPAKPEKAGRSGLLCKNGTSPPPILATTASQAFLALKVPDIC